MDTKSLFNNVDPQEGLEVLTYFLNQRTEDTLPCTQRIKDLAEIVL